MKTTVDLKIPASLQNIEPGRVKQYIDLFLVESAPKAKKIAQTETPVGATANLLKNITTTTGPNFFKLEWIASHAAPVQYGPKAHWAPIVPLRLWVEKVLGSANPRLPYKIRAKLARKRQPAKKYREKAQTKVGAYLRSAFKSRMELLALLFGGK